MQNPGHALRFTKPAKAKGKPRPVLPSADDMPILRRAAAGFIMVTLHQDGSRIFTYEDGSGVSLRRSHNDPKMCPGDNHFKRLVKEGWLIPDRKSSMFDDPGLAQVYHARKP